MPELPEVETIKRVLEPQLRGCMIQSVKVPRPEVIAHPDAADFCAALAGQKIRGMDRRGKFLQIIMESGDTVILHLRMTGCLLAAPKDHPAEKHTHVVFCLDNDVEVRFSDTRRFGRLWLQHAGEADTFSGRELLGPEPFDEGMTAEYLQSALGKSRRTIKACLLDQKKIAGIGNIYSDEILFSAKIRPDREACSLKKKEWERLAETIPASLSFFIEKNRITPAAYLKSKGQDYRNTPFLKVYGHEGEPCPTCGTPLRKNVIGGRSSVFCPKCQK